MAFYPHTLLQDSFSFFHYSGQVNPQDLRWNYRQGKTFQVEGDRGSIQRLLIVCLNEYIGLTPSIDITIGTKVTHNAPFKPALSFEPRVEVTQELFQHLQEDPQITRLLDGKRMAFFEGNILFPISAIILDTQIPPIDFLEMRSKYDDPKDAKLLFQLFFDSTNHRVEELHQAIQTKEFEDARRYAHSIKGSALLISAHQVAGVAKEIEITCKKREDDLSSRVLNHLMADLEKEFLRAHNYWKLEAKNQGMN
jgi:HPt (histidine-containing phosphotransfer) domain-containing protein